MLSVKRKKRVCIGLYRIPCGNGTDNGTDAMEVDQQTFIPGRTKLDPNEVLSPDPSTYDMLHTLSTPWPCLSFDIVKDSLGDNRKTYPATVYSVTGTQAEGRREQENELLVLKMSGLSK